MKKDKYGHTTRFGTTEWSTFQLKKVSGGIFIQSHGYMKGNGGARKFLVLYTPIVHRLCKYIAFCKLIVYESVPNSSTINKM